MKISNDMGNLCLFCNKPAIPGRKICHLHKMDKWREQHPEKYRANYRKQNKKAKLRYEKFKHLAERIAGTVPEPINDGN
jgi:hypothetical protein